MCCPQTLLPCQALPGGHACATQAKAGPATAASASAAAAWLVQHPAGCWSPAAAAAEQVVGQCGLIRPPAPVSLRVRDTGRNGQQANRVQCLLACCSTVTACWRGECWVPCAERKYCVYCTCMAGSSSLGDQNTHALLIWAPCATHLQAPSTCRHASGAPPLQGPPRAAVRTHT